MVIERLAAQALRIRWTLFVVAVATVLLGASTWVRTPAVIAAAVAVTTASPRRLGRQSVGGLESWIVGLGALLATPALLALLLNLLPGGITRVSWALGFGVIGALVLTLAPRRALTSEADAARANLLGRAVRTSVPWYAAAAIILTAALVIAVRATNQAERAPLALSAQRLGANQASVMVSSAVPGGRYQLVVERGADGTAEPAGDPFTLISNAPVERTVTLPPGRVTVRLIDAANGDSLRTVILDQS
jgi:hypothetical protein